MNISIIPNINSANEYTKKHTRRAPKICGLLNDLYKCENVYNHRKFLRKEWMKQSPTLKKSFYRFFPANWSNDSPNISSSVKQFESISRTNLSWRILFRRGEPAILYGFLFFHFIKRFIYLEFVSCGALNNEHNGWRQFSTFQTNSCWRKIQNEMLQFRLYFNECSDFV